MLIFVCNEKKYYKMYPLILFCVCVFLFLIGDGKTQTAKILFFEIQFIQIHIEAKTIKSVIGN